MEFETPIKELRTKLLKEQKENLQKNEKVFAVKHTEEFIKYLNEIIEKLNENLVQAE